MDPGGWRQVAAGAAVLALALAAYIADVVTHPLRLTLDWFDLNIYNHAGLIIRHAPGQLYTWHFLPGVQYLYTPFAALGFAAGSMLPWSVLTWLMTVASLAAMAATVWVTLGQLGWAGRRRWAAGLGLCGVALWTEPVLRSVMVGQIELLLMALIAWDLSQPDDRRRKGIGVGVAAGIKLVPLIFIPYLILAGRLRQAAVAGAAFAVTVLAGFAALPHESAKWWLTGYFLHAGDFSNTSLGSLLNQSVLALLTRTPAGTGSVTTLWVLFAAAIGVLGLLSAAALTRSGRPAAGWVTCALTGVLISPISWDNHWVWLVPLLVVLADAGAAARGARQWGYWGFGAALAVLFGDWPVRASGRLAWVPHGLVGFGVRRHHPKTEIFHLHGIQLVSWNLFVLGGTVMFAFMVAWAARSWHHYYAGPGRDGLTRTRPGHPAPVAGGRR